MPSEICPINNLSIVVILIILVVNPPSAPLGIAWSFPIFPCTLSHE
jgi:hypothetical protein